MAHRRIWTGGCAEKLTNEIVTALSLPLSIRPTSQLPVLQATVLSQPNLRLDSLRAAPRVRWTPTASASPVGYR